MKLIHQSCLGSLLRQKRIEKGLGLREAARLAGEHPGNLSATETGNRNPVPARVARILRSWGYKADAIVGVTIEAERRFAFLGDDTVLIGPDVSDDWEAIEFQE